MISATDHQTHFFFVRSYCLQWHFALRYHNPGCFILSPRISQCSMNSKCQGMLQDCAESRVMFSHPCWHCQNCWPTRLHHGLDVTWTNLLVTVGLCGFLLISSRYQEMSPGIWSVQALPWFHCLWTEMNFSDPFKHLQALRYFRNAEKRNTHAGETELQVTLNQWCQRDFYSQGGEELIPLWLTPHTLSQLWEMSENKRKTQIQHRKSIIWQFSYNSSSLGLTQRKEKKSSKMEWMENKICFKKKSTPCTEVTAETHNPNKKCHRG